MNHPDHPTHEEHDHVHGAGCGHTAIRHGDHICYLHDGHLHYPHEGHIDEHSLAVTEQLPGTCTHGQVSTPHETGHVHGPGCGHPAVPHGDHVDYLVGDHLHHPHDGHCDDHGKLEIVQPAPEQQGAGRG